MIRLTNRDVKGKSTQGTQVQIQYRDRIVEVPVEKIVTQTIEVPVVNTLEVPVEKTIEIEKIVHVQAEPVDLQPLHDKHQDLQIQLLNLADSTANNLKAAQNELEMQRQALVALKMQRDLDRKRRLTLLKKLKASKSAQKSSALKTKLAITAAILISIASLVVKL